MAWVSIVNGETGLAVSNKLDAGFGSLEARTTGTEDRLTEIETLKWDDLRAPASGINPAGQLSTPSISSADGSLLFSNNNVVAIWFQMPHGWAEGTVIRPHLHWTKTNTATGLPAWEMAYKWANPNEVFPAFSTFVGGSEAVENGNIADKHAIFSFPELSDTTKKLSSMLCILLRRGASDSYSGDVKLLEFDIHYQIDSKGSVAEYVK